MNERTVQQLPENTVKLITSTQVITSVSTAVKELVENSIDAGAKVIQVRLENYGLDLIEVKDDGSGVSYDNVQRMFLPGYTSKIKQFEDLEKLYSYGFRGEALSALCKVAKIQVTTKTNQDTLAMIYEIETSGLPVSSKPSHLNRGTMISVSGLFSNLPVRRLFLSSKKKMADELKKTENVIQSLSLIHPELSISFVHNKNMLWRKNSVKGIKQSLMQVAGLKSVSKMDYINKNICDIEVDCIIPKKNLENIDNIFSNSGNCTFVYVNKRPVVYKSLLQVVQEHIFHHYSKLDITFKYAACLLSVTIPPNQLDINLEPNKTKVLLKNLLDVIKVIDQILSNYYNNEDFHCSALREIIAVEEENNESQQENPAKRAKLVIDKSIGEKRSEDFLQKNKDWSLEIINYDCDVQSDLKNQKLEGETNNEIIPEVQSLCSQINQENCVLTTKEEVTQLNAILNETNFKLVTSTNSKNTETRLFERNDIQSRTTENPVIPEWPCRPVPKVIQESKNNNLENLTLNMLECSELENKTPEEIAAEIEKDAEVWSSEMISAMKEDEDNEVSEDSLVINEEDKANFNLSLETVSSQMGKKEMKAFTKFARVMRPKIIQEYPKILFTDVAKFLAERWKALSPEEIKYYEKFAEVIDFDRKVHQEERRISKDPEKPSKTSVKNMNVKSMLEKIKRKNKENRPPRREVVIITSMSNIKNLRSLMSSKPSDEFVIVGQLQPSQNWLYKKNKEIGHIRHQGLHEIILFQRMLSSYSVPKKPMPEPVILYENSLGTELWNVLVSLETECVDTFKFAVVNDVIVKNGFHINLEKVDSVITRGILEELASFIPHYGVPDLKDALRLFLESGESGGLASWRPMSVRHFITNEAIREAQLMSVPTREEIEDMMNTYHLCLANLPPVCLHTKDIFVPIHYIQEEVFSSQLES